MANDEWKARRSEAYRQKLLDPRWQRRRLEILNRDNFQCQQCGDEITTLHVHHYYYEKGKEPWEACDDALITMCATCHERAVQIDPRLEEWLHIAIRRSNIEKNEMSMLWQLANGICDAGLSQAEMRKLFTAVENVVTTILEGRDQTSEEEWAAIAAWRITEDAKEGAENAQ